MIAAETTETLLMIAAFAFAMFLIAFFIKLAVDVSAIRSMLENLGLFSGVPCPACAMPIPPRAPVCGHCGREVEVPAGGP